MEKLEHAQFIIERFDHYYEQVNNKGQFYLGLSSLMVGIVISNVEKISKIAAESYSFQAILIIFSLTSALSIILVLTAITPFLLSGKKSNYNTLIFFNEIAKLERQKFITEFNNQTEDDMANDYANQIHVLAQGLKLKYRHLYITSCFILIQSITIILITFKIFC